MTATQRTLVARLLGVAALLLASSGVGLATAPTASAAACSTSTGVTVVVDYGSLGGTSVRCADKHGSGIEALDSTGHEIGYVSPRQPMICTIDRLPDPCNGAPASAYWSYWRAKAGGSWSYSSLGAASTKPADGTVEGWAFGAGQPPSTRPPALPRPRTTTTTTSSTRATSGAGSSASGSSSTSSRAGRTSSSTRLRTTAGAAATASRPVSTAGSSASSATGSTATSSGEADPATGEPATTLAVASEPTSATTDSGSTGTLVVAGLLVLLLAGGAGTLAWRRRGSGV